MGSQEAGQRETIARAIGNTRRELERRTSALLDLRLRGLVSDEEYAAKRQELTAETLSLRERDGRTGDGGPSWFEPLARTLVFANQAPKRFAVAQNDEKREILLSLGSNLTLRDRMLRIQLQEPFAMLAKGPRSRNWQALVDGIRTFFQAHPTAIRWPSFCSAPLAAEPSAA